MQRWKAIVFNAAFALNCLLVFLLLFEAKLVVPSWIQLIGRMHPLLVHFPIVLLVLAVFWELFAGRKNVTPVGTTGNSLLLIAAITAVMSAIMGLLLSKEEGYSPETLALHKWSGVAVSLVSLGWYAFHRQLSRGRILSSLTALGAFVVMVITGHLGANITHGEDFIYAPVTAATIAPAVAIENAEVFTHMVQPIFKAKCAGCHNEQKAKGELIMASPELLLKGGKNGPLWDSTESDLGLLLRRVHLPLEAKKHMPPAGKPQLTETEIEIISAWIRSGADFKRKLLELPETDTLRLIAASMFTSGETAEYTFEAASPEQVGKLHNNYRTVVPIALGSPALGVEFFGASQYKPEYLKELLGVKNQVVALNLNKMPVTDADLAIIAQFSQLRKLNLSFTNVTGSQLAQLNKLKELRSLSLSGTAVHARELNSLTTLPLLSQLYIWSTPAQAENTGNLTTKLKRVIIEKGFSGDTILLKLNQPLIENEEQVILQPSPLKLKHFLNNVAIHYTTDGTEPDSLKSPLYKTGVLIDKSMTVKARAFKPGWVSSDAAEKVFFKSGYKIDSIELLQQPDPKYKSTGGKILTDNQKGDFNFGNGKWLGYRQTSFDAMLYLDQPKSLSSLTVSMLIDIPSYLMPPSEIIVWGGMEPGNLKMLKKIRPEQPGKEVPRYIKGYELAFPTTQVKYLKLSVVPVLKLPSWHGGKGERGWIFTDEIFLN